MHKRHLFHHLQAHIASCISYYPPSRPGTATTATNLARFFSRPPNHPAGLDSGSTSRSQGALSHRVWSPKGPRAMSSSNLLESSTRMLSSKRISSIEAKIGLWRSFLGKLGLSSLRGTWGTWEVNLEKLNLPRHQAFMGPDGREYLWKVYPEVCQVRITFTILWLCNT